MASTSSSVKPLAAQRLGQQRHICRRFQLVLAADAVKVAAKADDLNAAHLLEVCRVLCQPLHRAAAELGVPSLRPQRKAQ